MSRKLLKSTAIVSVMTILSRILGFIRDMVLAQVFGAKATTDAFFVAFKIPNFMRRLFAEGAFAQSFVPVLGEYKAAGDEAKVKDLVDHVTGTLGLMLLAITVVGIILAPILIMIFAPGFILAQGSEQADLAGTMLRLTFPYLLFISLTALAGGILNTYGHFAVPAFTPVLLNLCMISAAIWLSPEMDEPVMALAWGVLAAGVAQLLFQIPYLLRIRMLPRPRFVRQHGGVQKIMKLMLPAIFGSSVAQINLLLDTVIASFLTAGSVSWLYYSDRLVEFPLGVFGIALATVILPSLSGEHAERSQEKFSMILDWALRWGMLVGIPATVGLFMLAAPIITTLFQYGEFSADAVLMTSYSLMAYSIGLIGFIQVKVLVPAFFARQDAKTPVKIGILAMVSNMILNIVIVVPMALQGAYAPHAGLALATAFSAIINASLLYRALRKKQVFTPCPGWLKLVLQITLACVAMAYYLHWVGVGTAEWLAMDAGERVLKLFYIIVFASLIYTAMLLITGARPWRWKVSDS